MARPTASVFTPTHDPRYLPQLYDNLRAQTITDWEWVIAPNAGAKIPEFNDPRVRVAPDFQHQRNVPIGALKRYAATACHADAIVELDHDDFLSLNALERIGAAVAWGADFVFSDFAEFSGPGHAPREHSRDDAWFYRDVTGPDGRPYRAATSPPAEVPWILLMSHAPNHVRAWRRGAYDAAGGHDASLAVADDFDLVIRTYLSGASFVHIPECLYFYRLHEGNTYVRTHTLIRSIVDDVYARRLPAVLLEWTRRRGLARLALGCARRPPPYMDLAEPVPSAGATHVFDFNAPWAIPDSSVGMLLVRESAATFRSVTHLMNECWRVLAPQGMVLIDTPIPPSALMMSTEPGLSLDGLLCYCRDSQRPAGFRGGFMPLRIASYYPTPEHQRANQPWLQAHLSCIKPGGVFPHPWPWVKAGTPRELA